MAVNNETPMNQPITKLVKIFEWVACACLVGITVVIFVQIIFRNFFSIGFAWADELSRFFHITLIYLSVPILFREQILIKVDYFVKYLSPEKQVFTKFFSIIVCVVFCLIFLYSITEFMSALWDVATPALRMPNLFFFFSTFLGILLLLLAATEELFKEIKKLAKD